MIDSFKFLMLMAECFAPTLLFFGLSAVAISKALAREFSNIRALIGIVIASATSTLFYVALSALGGNALGSFIAGPVLASAFTAFAVSTPRHLN